MLVYTCPMHPDIRRNRKGKCPKCGMRLVASVKGKNISDSSKISSSSTWKDYAPLAIIISAILLATILLAFMDSQVGNFAISRALSYFMIGFFLVFAGFKLIGLKGFAEGYSTYDILARRVFAYGYVYPFIELFFGLAMIITNSRALLIAEFMVMAFSGVGVAIKLMKKEKFQCVCLGTILKVPLTKITLVEDFGMAALALILLLIA